MRDVGLEEVVPAALASLADRPDARRCSTSPETLPRVHADPALLERAVANLVDNAVPGRPPDSRVRGRGGRASATGSTSGSSTTAPASRSTSASRCSSRSSGSATSPNGSRRRPRPRRRARASSRRWAASSTVEDTPAAASRWCISLPRAARRDAACWSSTTSRRSARALGDQPPGPRLRGRPRRDRARRRSSSRPRTTPTSWCSTSACPASTASR